MADSSSIAKLAVEYWKLLRAFERMIERLPPEHVAKTAAQARFSAGRLDAILKEGGLLLATFDGQRFEANIPATALNVEDFGDEEGLIVKSTVEPAVIKGTQVLTMGRVILAKGDSGVSRD